MKVDQPLSSAGRKPLRRPPVEWIVAAALTAVIIRLFAAYALQDSFLERGIRSNIIHPIAMQLLAGNGFAAYPGGPTADNEPMYPVFVAASYALLGIGWWVVAVTQTLMGILHACLLYRISRILFTRASVAWCAAGLCLFYPMYAIASISISDTVFFSCILALCTLLTLKAAREDNPGSAAIAGAAWGLAMLTRLSAAALMPAVAIHIWIASGRRRGAAKIGIIAAVALAAISPWLWRNYRLTGRAFVTSHGAIELWFAYNDETEAMLRRKGSVDWMRYGITSKIPALSDIRSEPGLAPIDREIREADAFRQAALSYLAANPGQSLRMMPLKLLRLWSWNYNPVPTSPDPAQDKMRRWVHALSYGPVLLLAIAGVGFHIRKLHVAHMLPFMYFACYSALHAAVYGLSRLRWPIDQFLLIYAVAGVFVLGDFRPRRMRK